jgi:hypothetical protein
LARTRAEVLRGLAVDSGVVDRIDRLQVMVVAMGDALGMDEAELWRWRTVLVVGEAGQSLGAEAFGEILPEWMETREEYLFRQSCLVAEAWDSAWLADEGDLRRVVVGAVGSAVDERVLSAFESVVDVIVPLWKG